MKTMIKVLLIVNLFTLIPMFNALEAADVYVIGSPTDLPEQNKTIPVDIRVVDSPSYGYIQVSITQQSYMNGYCTNYPVDDSGNINDIQLHKTDNSGWTEPSPGVLKYEISLSPPESTTYEVPLKVRTYDYGAWAKITATLYEDTGHGFKKRDTHTGTAPRDENGNHIADGWENDFTPYEWSDKKNRQVDVGATRAQAGIQDYPYSKPFLGKRQNTVDKETGPTGNTENGDGFTVFEEYRGFMLHPSRFTRFSPTTKEVGIAVHQSITKYGTGSASSHYPSFQRMSSSEVKDPFIQVRDKDHNLKSDVSHDVGWINTNSNGLPDTQRVYAVRIQNAGSHPENTRTLGKAPMTIPCRFSYINIYVDTITNYQQNRLPNYTVKDIVNHVIGHEAGHTVNLDHCPEECRRNTTTCMMRPSVTVVDDDDNIVQVHVGASPSSYHYIDYDLVWPIKSPQLPYQPPEEESEDTPQKAITSTLVSSDSVYTATAGDSHTANFSSSSPYSSIYWYVKSPSDTSGYGTTIEIDQGDGSLTTADFTYTFPSGVSGDYQIMAYTYFTGAIVEPSYTVSVSLPSSTTTTTTTTSGLYPTNGSYTYSAGGTHEATCVTTTPYQYVAWYVNDFLWETDAGNGSATEASFSYTFPSDASGDYVIKVEVQAGTYYTDKYTVSLPSSTETTAPAAPAAPVWSDMPGPYSLTAGDSFSLDLSSYVTGSQTIIKYGGFIPEGLSVNTSGVLSGTVSLSSRSETRFGKFRASNDAGDADSGWITFVITGILW